MTIAIDQLQIMASEYSAYKLSLLNALSSLDNIITQGTALYNNSNMATQFPNSWVTYQAYLISVRNAINTFIAGFPVEPSLN